VGVGCPGRVTTSPRVLRVLCVARMEVHHVVDSGLRAAPDRPRRDRRRGRGDVPRPGRGHEAVVRQLEARRLEGVDDVQRIASDQREAERAAALERQRQDERWAVVAAALARIEGRLEVMEQRAGGGENHETVDRPGSDGRSARCATRRRRRRGGVREAVADRPDRGGGDRRGRRRGGPGRRRGLRGLGLRLDRGRRGPPSLRRQLEATTTVLVTARSP